MHSNKGFSLIELMITVGIIGILAVLALPMFRDYVIKTRVTQAIFETTAFRQDVYDELVDQWRTVNPGVWSDTDYKSDIVDTVRISRNIYTGPEGIQVTKVSYNIYLNKKNVGLSSLFPDPDQARQIVVTYITRYMNSPSASEYYDEQGVGHIPAKDQIVGPFCGQGWGNAGYDKDGKLSRTNTAYVPRKYLPTACKDGYIMIGSLMRLMKDSATDHYTRPI